MHCHYIRLSETKKPYFACLFQNGFQIIPVSLGHYIFLTKPLAIRVVSVQSVSCITFTHLFFDILLDYMKEKY